MERWPAAIPSMVAIFAQHTDFWISDLRNAHTTEIVISALNNIPVDV